MDFLLLASISMPAIHGKTNAKVTKRNETGKKIINFLTNPKNFHRKKDTKESLLFYLTRYFATKSMSIGKRRKVANKRLPAVPFSNLWMVVKPSPVSSANSFWVRLHHILYSLNLTPSKRTNSGVEYSYKSAIIFYYLSIIIMIFIPYISLYLQYTDIYGCKYNKKK